jgi:hypothetical protein
VRQRINCTEIAIVRYVGGNRGFSKVIWTVKEYVAGGDSPYITLYYRSFDGEQGTEIEYSNRGFLLN